jgi:two-component system, OmpR family, KDP operon response regulator KdpE
MIRASILVIDDDHQIRRTLRAALSSTGYDVIDAEDADEGIEKLVREHPDLVLLDVNLPEMNGIEACGEIRRWFQGPIIMLTVRSGKRDKIDAFNAGADDYVIKPFSTDELLARIQAALRRSHFGQPLPKIETAELTIDLDSRIIEVQGNRAHLTPHEFEVLRVLVTQQGKAVTHKRLLQTVWGPDYGEELEKIRGVIREIRKKIEKDPAHPRYIITEPWFGYRFQIPNGTSGAGHGQ